MKFLRVITFLLFSVLDVRVHAGSTFLTLQQNITQHPAECLASTEICSLKTMKGYKFDFALGNAQITMGPDSIVIRNDLDSITLVQGEVWVKSESIFKIQSEYGTVQVHQGHICTIREGEKMLVRTLAGETTLLPRGDTEVTVPVGFENWISPADKKGRAGVGIPSAISFRDHILRWTRMSGKNFNETKAELESQKQIWANAVFEVSHLHRDIIDREMATAGARERRRAHQQKLSEEETARLHEIFRKKNTFQ